MARDYHPYSTAEPMLPKAPAWITNTLEQFRVGSYDMYEMIYWSHPDTFELVQRGSDEDPIYIPAGRTIVETLHRYLANDMKIIPDPQFGTTSQQQQALLFWTDMVRRERFYSMFNMNKRLGIIRGDWIFHMRGDPERLEGSRVSIETIHPGSLFPIYELDDDGNEIKNSVIGWHVIERVLEGTTELIKRTTYRKTTETGGPSPITFEVGLYEINAWGGADQEEKMVRSIESETAFPAPIDQLPIYHVKNTENDSFLWGSSEMRGLESLMAHVDQAISDEELEIVLNGLGVYATNADNPVDPESGEPIDWDLGPGRVVKIPGLGSQGQFVRVTGTTTVAPHQDHLKYLHERLDESAGTPAVAKGKVDVQTAESGVSLLLQMGPLLARVSEKEQIITDVITNYMFDLSKWIVAYEGGQWSFLMDQIRFIPVYGDKIPMNRKERFTEVMAMATAMPMPIIPLNVAWDELRKIGYDLPENEEMLAAILEQRQAASTAEADAMASRIEGEIGEAGEPSENGQEEETETEAETVT
jgi:hypothetical protein